MLKLFGPKGEHWCRGKSSADEKGVFVEPRSPRAQQWCLAGAHTKLNGGDKTWKLLSAAVPGGDNTGFGGSIAGFNDSRKTFAHVKKFLTKLAGE